MAEMAVSFAIDKLLPLLMKEANLLKGIHKEFAVIKDEFESIQAFLKDAERRATAEGDNRDEGIKTWVKQVTEAAFCIEDVIDEYMIHMGWQPHHPGCSALSKKIAHLIKTPISRHQIASKIRDIKSTILEISERSKRYSFQNQPSSEQGSSNFGGSQNVKWYDPRMASLYVEDAELVGFETPRDELIGWLVDGREERAVISVVGLGGQGKTTLASKVFNNPKVIGHFDLHAWIAVSQSYNVEGLLRDMLLSFCKEKREDPPKGISEMSRHLLTEEIRNHLQQKRYVIVFDDVWNIQFWDEIEFSVFDNKRRSRIIITTRNRAVAMSCRKSSFIHLHELQPLTPEKSLELFYKKAFPFDHRGCCPKDLVNISSEIVRKCQGLPLAIVVIGSLLSCKEKTASEWESFGRNLSSELEKDSRLSSITKILGFSYDDLPYHLKSCFLYFGMYPEDREVKSRRLIWQWIAEGFVKYEKGKTMEEVAEQYLVELVGRSLVQVSSFTKEGKVKGCRVHDLTREMVLKKCKDLSFGEYISGDDESMISGIVRRQSIATSSGNFIESPKLLHVRSLFFFLDGELSEDYETKLFKNYKLLKVLDFEGARQLHHVPKKLENLIHLKYLSFKGTKLTGSLPKSIDKLQNLETLILCGIYTIVLPKEICKLRKLRHLVSEHLPVIEVKDGIGGMTSLQTLKHKGMLDDKYGVELIRELVKLKQLRELGLKICITKDDGSGLCSLLNEMQQLEKQGIIAESTNDPNRISSPPKLVLKLLLIMKLNKLPERVQEIKNLVILTLLDTELIEDPLKSLQNLPNLAYLSMIRAYSGEGLHFEEGGFQNLKELLLGLLLNLNSITIDKGAMSSLKKLTFNKLDELKKVPNGISHLEKLQVFRIWAMLEFEQRIAADGEDHWIIKHVPHVQISH